ncbi:hypothetical protein [Pandoraea cepalis]|uniref:Uncharacterized protein n=1 Tax=Pandoraea cepalis TaxID=2508294 RepID=A0A5E4VW68_9BURK|nr:hypothetical protein [Pandoraea cepalis]VVE16817.1 hypothetical protein PCE31107_02938 [Pandoraea cepalis]
MNRNLQAFCVIRTQHEIVFGDQLILVQEFRTELKEALADASVVTLIEQLESGGNVAQFDEDTWWTIVDDLKAHLGSQCANMAGDSRDEQESALVAAETWVEENISNATRAEIVAAAVVHYGYSTAGTMIRELNSPVAA